MLFSFLTNASITGLTVLSGVMLARLLGPEGRGQLAAIQALPIIIAGIGQLGLNEAVIFFGGKDRERVGRWAVSAAALICLTGIPIVAVSAALLPFVLNEYSPQVVLAAQIFLGLLFVNVIDGIAITTARALHRISLWNTLRVFPRVLWVLLVAFFFFRGVASPERIAVSYLLGYLVLAPLMVVAVRRYLRGHWRPIPSLWPRMLKYGLPVAAGVAPRLLNDRVDQLIVATMLPPRELGLYAVAVSWAALGALPGMTMTAVAFSKITGMPDLATQLRFIRKALWAVAVAATGTAAALAVATPIAIPLVFSDKFADATELAWIMLVGVVLRSVAWMLQVGMQGIGRPSVGLYSQWTGLAVLLAAAAFLIPAYGARGAAWSLVVSSFAAGVIGWVFYRKARAESEG